MRGGGGGEHRRAVVSRMTSENLKDRFRLLCRSRGERGRVLPFAKSRGIIRTSEELISLQIQLAT